MTPGKHYDLTYTCRDIGYGVEEGDGTFEYRGIDTWGKRELVPDDGPTIYLFDDEITSCEEVEVYRDATYSAATQELLRALLADLTLYTDWAEDPRVFALTDVIERWDANDAAETTFPTEEETMSDDVTVYDNGGETFDRYTVIFGDSGYALGIGDTGNVPNGFCQHLDPAQIDLGPYLGRIIPVSEMTEPARRAVEAELRSIAAEA